MMGFPNDPTFYGDDLPKTPQPPTTPDNTDHTHPDQEN